MPRIKYQDFNFRAETLTKIQVVNNILYKFAANGYNMTLRQVYYQMVKANLIANNAREYDKLGTVINNGRLAGLIDWKLIVDRTRDVEKLPSWKDSKEIVTTTADQFRIDQWATQPYRVEAWIEKDALKDVLGQVCELNHVPYFSCRGYTSQSEMWEGAQRLLNYHRDGQKLLILYLGDHDPSGIDMTRDITDRLKMFMGGVPVERLALNINQIEELQPPENPAKLSDSRATDYIKKYGRSSWELDALDPDVITTLVQDAIDRVRDPELWQEAEDHTHAERELLAKAGHYWNQLTDEYLSKKA